MDLGGYGESCSHTRFDWKFWNLNVKIEIR